MYVIDNFLFNEDLIKITGDKADITTYEDLYEAYKNYFVIHTENSEGLWGYYNFISLVQDRLSITNALPTKNIKIKLNKKTSIIGLKLIA